MISPHSKAIPTAVSLVLLMYGSVFAAPDVPARSKGGQTLAVPQEQLDLGEIYYVTPGEDSQLVCTSDAPLQHVAAVCNRVVGYVVAPFDAPEDRPPLLAGAFRIPAVSLRTASKQTDEMLRSPTMLNADKYPEITFRITGVSGSKLVGEDGGRKNYTLNVAGQLTVKDKTVDLELPVRLSVIPFTWKTMGRSVGELLTMRTRLDLKLADLGLQKPSPAHNEMIADEISVDVFLMCNTVTPEINLDPKIKREDHLKQLQILTQVRDFNDPDKGYELARGFVREIWDDAQALNRLAWALLTEDDIQTRDLSLSLKAAQRANELTEFKDPVLLNTLARAWANKAEWDNAVKWARQSVDNLGSTPPDVAADIRAALQRYETQAEKNRE